MSSDIVILLQAAAVGGPLLLVVLAPAIERRCSPAVTGIALVAVLSWALAAWTGLTPPGPALPAFGMLAAGLLVWSAGAYAVFRARSASARGDAAQAQPVTGGANCRPRLTSGSALVDGQRTKGSWRTYLYTVFSTSPSNGGLKEKAQAWGGAYYVLYFTTGKAKAEPSVEIVCERGDDGKCLADGSEKGALADSEPPVRVQVANAISSEGSRVRVAAQMSAALSASGGPTITFGAKGVEVAISFPDASLDDPRAMGTYRWVCEKVEE
jgi:hypothetical protein